MDRLYGMLLPRGPLVGDVVYDGIVDWRVLTVGRLGDRASCLCLDEDSGEVRILDLRWAVAGEGLPFAGMGCWDLVESELRLGDRVVMCMMGNRVEGVVCEVGDYEVSLVEAIPIGHHNQDRLGMRSGCEDAWVRLEDWHVFNLLERDDR